MRRVQFGKALLRERQNDLNFSELELAQRRERKALRWAENSANKDFFLVTNTDH